MATQSRHAPAPAILLTRPAEQAERFALALKARFGDELRVVISPVTMHRFLDPELPRTSFSALVFTSEAGVAAYRRMHPMPHLRAFCVGDETARAARAAGLEAISAQGDARALVSRIANDGTPGPLLHLRGRETTGNLVIRLAAIGVELVDLIAYEQKPFPLKPEALALLASAETIILPVFSARSAERLSQAIAAIARHPVIRVAALSPAVAAAAQTLNPISISVARHPDAMEMVDAIARLIAADTQP